MPLALQPLHPNPRPLTLQGPPTVVQGHHGQEHLLPGLDLTLVEDVGDGCHGDSVTKHARLWLQEDLLELVHRERAFGTRDACSALIGQFPFSSDTDRIRNVEVHVVLEQLGDVSIESVEAYDEAVVDHGGEDEVSVDVGSRSVRALEETAMRPRVFAHDGHLLGVVLHQHLYLRPDFRFHDSGLQEDALLGHRGQGRCAAGPEDGANVAGDHAACRDDAVNAEDVPLPVVLFRCIWFGSRFDHQRPFLHPELPYHRLRGTLELLWNWSFRYLQLTTDFERSDLISDVITMETVQHDVDEFVRLDVGVALHGGARLQLETSPGGDLSEPAPPGVAVDDDLEVLLGPDHAPRLLAERPALHTQQPRLVEPRLAVAEVAPDRESPSLRDDGPSGEGRDQVPLDVQHRELLQFPGPVHSQRPAHEPRHDPAGPERLLLHRRISADSEQNFWSLELTAVSNVVVARDLNGVCRHDLAPDPCEPLQEPHDLISLLQFLVVHLSEPSGQHAPRQVNGAASTSGFGASCFGLVRQRGPGVGALLQEQRHAGLVHRPDGVLQLPDRTRLIQGSLDVHFGNLARGLEGAVASLHRLVSAVQTRPVVSAV